MSFGINAKNSDIGYPWDLIAQLRIPCLGCNSLRMSSSKLPDPLVSSMMPCSALLLMKSEDTVVVAGLLGTVKLEELVLVVVVVVVVAGVDVATGLSFRVKRSKPIQTKKKQNKKVKETRRCKWSINIGESSIFCSFEI